jgi:hypothetical protein
MATSVSKKIECRKITAIFNQIHIHNPKNIDADNIKVHLMQEFKGVFEISYNMRKKNGLVKIIQLMKQIESSYLLCIFMIL